MPTTLFDTLKVGSLSVPSRIFMVTRPRCEFFDTVTDLPARIAAGADLNAPKADLFYTGKVGDLTYTGPEGYTDYPTLP